MLLQRKHLFGTTILAGAMALSSAALAQTATTTAQQPAQTEESERQQQTGTRLDEVVVTGSRIRRNEFTSAQPIQVITTEQQELKGNIDAAATLQGSSLAAGSFQWNDQLTGYVTAGGGGTQLVALRGLGAQRTLTLLNGRRAGPAGTRGQVQAFDLNVIPASQVERFDILKDGASSIYGSDAVAGVINVITKRNLDGGAFNIATTQTVEGGGEIVRGDATWGRTFDNGYFNVSGEFYKQWALRREDRDDTGCAADYLFSPDQSRRLDYIDPRTGDYKCYNLANGYIQAAFPAALGGTMNLVPISRYGGAYNYAVPGNNAPAIAAGQGFARWGRAGYPGTYLYGPYDSDIWNRATVISPSERFTLTFTGGYDLSPDAEIYTELLYNRRSSEQNGAAQIFQNFAQRNILFGASNVLPASNPNNTLGVNAVTVTAYESSSAQEIDYYRGVVGLRGQAPAFGRDWDWDVYAQYSLSDGVYNNGPRIYLDRLLALNSPGVACTNNPAGGNFSNFNCADLPGGIPWMSERILLGQFTDAERNFLFFEEDHTTTYDYAYIEGVITTDRLFSLPAGDVGAAFGFQYREEEIDDTPGYQARNRNVALFTSAGRTTGSDAITESFAEIELPILRAAPFAEDLTLNLSGRLSNYDSYGSSETYKISANWQITPEYRIRASHGTSFRAPALYELYLGAQVGYSGQSAVDPCYDYTDSGVDTEIQTACAALGIPAQYTAVGGSSAAVSSIGGAGYLEAETADSFNVGFIWTPSFIDLSVAVDYFDIAIHDQVDQFGGYNIIEQCLRGNTDFCSLFTRDPTNFYILTVDNSYVNIAEQTSRGIDLAFRYNHELPFGDLTIESQHTWKLEDHVNLLGGVEEDYLGDTFNYNGPAYAGNLNFTLQQGDLTWFYGIDAIGRGSDVEEAGGHVFANSRYADLTNGISSADCSAANNYCAYYKYYTEFTTIHTASVRMRVNDWTFRAGIQNLWDERPPAVNTGEFRLGTAALSGYDMRGRRVFFGIGRTF